MYFQQIAEERWFSTHRRLYYGKQICDVGKLLFGWWWK